MQKCESRLTVYFSNPFWVGVYERVQNGKLEVCKIPFGSEPRDCEVYAFLQKNWGRLRFGAPVEAKAVRQQKISPKRMQRIIKKQLGITGVGTRAQQAMALQRTAGKALRKKYASAERQKNREQQFAQKQQKKKEKRKGH